jgi:NADH-quinone oxidoreductase subunit C
MNELLSEISKIGGASTLEERSDGWWMVAPGLDVCAVAKQMRSHQMRLATVTSIARDDGETDLIYHYNRDGFALNLKVSTQNNTQFSITTIIPAADWIEREIHDLYAVQFTGHPNLARLVLPPEIPDGLFRQPGGEASKTGRNV